MFKISNMDSLKLSETQPLSMFISQRLTAAVEEILEAVERAMAEYEEKVNKSNFEIDRQRKLLDILLNPHVKLHRKDFQQQHCEQEKSPSLAQKNPEPPQRDHNLWTGQGEEKLRELEEADIFPVIVANQITPEPDREGCGEPQSPRDSQPLSEIETEDGDDDNDLMQDSLTLTSKKSQPLGKGLRPADSTKGSSDCSTLVPHKDTTVFCKVCRFPCSSDGALLQHVQTHAAKGSRVCGVCGMFLESPHSLVLHIQIHRYKLHIRTHSGEKPYRCSVCWKCFRHLDAVKNHRLIHTEEKPYECGVCGMCFRNINTLKKHKFIHAERSHRCSVCGKGFTHPTTLMTHEAVHKKEKSLM